VCQEFRRRKAQVGFQLQDVERGQELVEVATAAVEAGELRRASESEGFVGIEGP
jgi:hypothetical protein